MIVYATRQALDNGPGAPSQRVDNRLKQKGGVQRLRASKTKSESGLREGDVRIYVFSHFSMTRVQWLSGCGVVKGWP